MFIFFFMVNNVEKQRGGVFFSGGDGKKNPLKSNLPMPREHRGTPQLFCEAALPQKKKEKKWQLCKHGMNWMHDECFMWLSCLVFNDSSMYFMDSKCFIPRKSHHFQGLCFFIPFETGQFSPGQQSTAWLLRFFSKLVTWRIFGGPSQGRV